MGGLTPALVALAGRLTRAGSRDRRPVGPAPSRAEPAEDGSDPATLDLDLTKILAMPLDHFAREGHLLEVQVPWLDVTLWFVPEERDAEALGHEGVSRGRIWTAEELLHVMRLASGGTVPTLSIAKLAMDGHIVEVSARDRGDPDGRGRPQGHRELPAKRG